MTWYDPMNFKVMKVCNDCKQQYFGTRMQKWCYTCQGVRKGVKGKKYEPVKTEQDYIDWSNTEDQVREEVKDIIERFRLASYSRETINYEIELLVRRIYNREEARS